MSDKTDNPKFNVLLEGPIGTGKTHSCRTLIENDLVDKLFILSVEQGIETVMGDMPKDRVHWHYIAPSATDFDTMVKNAQIINSSSMEQLQKMTSPSKREHQQFIDIYKTLSNFKCDRTGEEFGPVDEWGPEYALVIDGLSGVSDMALKLVVGDKPIVSQPEWGVAMKQIRTLLDKCCYDTKSTFVLLAHVTRNRDEVTGGTYITIDTLGQKLAPDIPKPFDEVILTKREQGAFKWSTEQAMTDLKARILPFSDNLEPNFKQLWDAWQDKRVE